MSFYIRHEYENDDPDLYVGPFDVYDDSTTFRATVGPVKGIVCSRVKPPDNLMSPDETRAYFESRRQ